jgi:hypothetical protein
MCIWETHQWAEGSPIIAHLTEVKCHLIDSVVWSSQMVYSNSSDAHSVWDPGGEVVPSPKFKIISHVQLELCTGTTASRW